MAKFPQLLQDTVNKAVNTAVQEKVNEKLNTILPAYIEQYNKWKKGGKRGPRPVPSIVSARSDNEEVLVTSPSPAVPKLTLSGTGKAPAGTVQASSHSATCALAVGGASTLAELDAVKVTN